MQHHTAPLLLRLQQQLIRYFIENQLSHGLVLDRQRNFGRRKYTGLCSLSATGMGLIGLALATDAGYGSLLTRAEARSRCKKAIRTALSLPQVAGMMPHFVDAQTLKPVGSDAISTVDSAWLFAGALWVAEFFNEDAELRALANQLYERVDWTFWSSGSLLHHGADVSGKKLTSVWDRFNAETAFMYVLGIGAQDRRKALPAASWNAMRLFQGALGKYYFASSDLGLFVFQYSLLLLDGCELPPCRGATLLDECIKGMRANEWFCTEHRGRYQTYDAFWGLSAGDGPCTQPDKPKVRRCRSARCTRQTEGSACEDAYRAYSPKEFDGTAHVLATVASIDLLPELVIPNIEAAESVEYARMRGRYGYSNINVDRNWVSRDVVGIDVGAAMFALDNALNDERIRNIFMRLQPVRRSLRRIRTYARKKA